MKRLVGCVYIVALGQLGIGACSSNLATPASSSSPAAPAGGAGTSSPPRAAGAAAMPPAPAAGAGPFAEPPPTAAAAPMPLPAATAGTMAWQGPPSTAAAGVPALQQPVAGEPAAVQPPAAGAGTLAPQPQPPPRAELDPNAKFEWEETAPGSSRDKACRAGVYTGTSEASCMPVGVMDMAAAIPGLGGPVVIELAESANGEFLEIANGEFTSLSADVFGLHSTLAGTLDCKTLQFTAKTVDGMWGLGDPSMILPLGTFEAELLGTLVPSTGVLSGQWMMTGSVPFMCLGMWSVTLAP